jgi:hypothetical protein
LTAQSHFTRSGVLISLRRLFAFLRSKRAMAIFHKLTRYLVVSELPTIRQGTGKQPLS